MQTLSYVLNIIGTCAMVFALVRPGEKIKQILFFTFLGNFLVATGYLVGGSGINGAISCYVGAAITIVNFTLQSKHKPIPKWLVAIYALAFIGLNLAGGFTWLCLLAIAACMTFVLSVIQNNGAIFRVWTFANMILWISYDLLSKSYAGLIPHVVMLVFTLVGMFVQDRKKQ